LEDNLRILFITYTHSGGGGAEAVLTNLVNHLPNYWHIDILETLDFSLKKEPINANINLLSPLTNIAYKMIDHMTQHMFFVHPEVIKALRELYGYDVVIGWMYRDATFMLPAFPECKKIAWFHGMVDDLLPDYPANMTNYYARFKLDLQRKACSCADRILEISNKTKASVIRVLPEFCDKLEVIYNGVDIAKILHSSEKQIDDSNAEKIYKYVLNTDKPILISMGKLEYNKNFSLALNALFILKQKNIFANYLIVGKGDVEGETTLVELVDSLGLGDRVFFMGFQQNPLPMLKGCKLLLITSFEEGFPTVATEAMALGIPFVTTPVAGASEELANNEMCGLVSGWDAKEYAEKIEILLKDDVLYKKMSNVCKEHVQHFSMQSTLATFYEMLESIPKKVVKDKKIGKAYALLLFILYAPFGYIFRNKEILKFRFCVFRRQTNLVNVYKLLFRFSIFFMSILCLPLITIYSAFLTLRYKNRLFGYE